MIKRFAYIKWIGVLIIVFTGSYQWYTVYPEVIQKTSYLIAFAIKMAGAFGLFSITFLLALPNERLVTMQQNRAFWTIINIFCGLVILIGAALMKMIREGQFF